MNFRKKSKLYQGSSNNGTRRSYSMKKPTYCPFKEGLELERDKWWKKI